MNREEKRYARICALQMAYAYEMTQKKENLKDIDIDNDKFKNMKEIKGYSLKLVDQCLNLDKQKDSSY